MEIKLYTEPGCPYCRMAKEFLDGRGVPYAEFDISASRVSLRKAIALTGKRAVPVIVCGSDVIVGFSPSRLEQMIECERNQTQFHHPVSPLSRTAADRR
jgi:alkyl hydroperoxide reductase subunit F